MRKWLFLMLAGYFWKKYSARGAVRPAARSPVRTSAESL
jgi:hypothetical protein